MSTAAEPVTEVFPPIEPKAWEAIPDGEYAIVELFGHQTLIGRISEVDRFGAKMLALEPLFNGRLLDPVLHGGAAIYRLTPCTREVAWDKQPKKTWQLPTSIQAIVPAELLPAPAADEQPSEVEDLDDDERPF